MSSTEIKFSNQLTASFDKPTLILYIVEGFFIAVVNFFLTVRLFSHKDLRGQKEYIIIGACLFFDVIFGLTYFTAGVYRAIPVVLYEYFPLVSMWTCFVAVHTQLFIITTTVSGIVLLLTAVDRFICVFLPFTYMKHHAEYAYKLMALPYLIHLALLVPAAIASYNNGSDKTSTQTCFVKQAVTLGYFVTYRMIRIVSAIGCICIYVPIFVKMYVTLNKQSQLTVGSSSKNQKRLVNMTITVAMITGSTICLFTIPDVILFISPQINSNFILLMSLNKGIVNLIIFLTTQKSLRNFMLPRSMQKTSAVHPSQSKTTVAPVR